MKIERLYTEENITFLDIIDPFVKLKVEEIVNNANKVNTATSQNPQKGIDVLC